MLYQIPIFRFLVDYDCLINQCLVWLLGRPSDIMLAAPVAALLCIQLGAGEESEEVLTTVRPQLSAFIQDKRLASSVRANVPSVLHNCVCVW